MTGAVESSIALGVPASLNISSAVIDVPLPAPRTFLPFNTSLLVTAFSCNRVPTTSMRVELVQCLLEDFDRTPP